MSEQESGSAQEMTLEQWVERLPPCHRAVKELASLRAKLAKVTAERERLHADLVKCKEFWGTAVNEKNRVTAERDALKQALTGCADLLTNIAQILDVIKQEWGYAWSAWDQGQRDEITRWLTAHHARGKVNA